MEKLLILLGVVALVLVAVVGYISINVEGPVSHEVVIEIDETPVVKLIPLEEGIVLENLTASEVRFERFFIDELEATGVLTEHSSVLDIPPLGGTEYLYVFETGGETRSASVVSALSEESLKRGLFYSWELLSRQREVPKWVFEIKRGSRVFRWVIHGTEIVVVFEPEVRKRVSENLMKAYFKQAVIDFHRHWTMYRGFPIDEYRIIAMDGEEMPPFSETVFGHHIPKSFLLKTIRSSLSHNCEPLSHGIGHAWIGDLISTEVHSVDGWWLEGFDHFNGIITLKSRVKYLMNDVEYLKRSPYKNFPLSKAYSKFFGTGHAYLYYAKGGLLAYLISKRLKENRKSWEGFMAHLYEKYFLSENGRWRPYKDEKRLSTRELLEELNEFSGLDFSDLFEKYVYGEEDITSEILTVDERYLPEWNNRKDP